jgi:hypothetical protein
MIKGLVKGSETLKLFFNVSDPLIEATREKDAARLFNTSVTHEIDAVRGFNYSVSYVKDALAHLKHSLSYKKDASWDVHYATRVGCTSAMPLLQSLPGELNWLCRLKMATCSSCGFLWMKACAVIVLLTWYKYKHCKFLFDKAGF